MTFMQTQVLDLPEIEPLIGSINEKYVNTGLTYGWKSVVTKKDDYGHWNNMLMNANKHYLMDHTKLPFIAKKYPEVLSLWNILRPYMGRKKLLRVYINGYTYGTDAYYHMDDTWVNEKYGHNALTETAVIYLNSEWEPDWGGETSILDDSGEIEKSVLPKKNRVLIFNANKLHSARPLSRSCPELRKVLVFKTIGEGMPTKEIDMVQKYLGENHDLFKHSYKISGLLEKYDQTTPVVLAGLYHAIYKSPLVNRDDVKKVIGEYAEQLVYDYFNMDDKFDCLMQNKNNYNIHTLKDLLYIYFVDLLRYHKYNGQHESEKLERIYKRIERLQKEIGVENE